MKKILLVGGDPNSINSEIIFKSWNKISKSLNCSKLTTQKYLLDLYENDIINFELDKVDKRKKNIIFTSNFINELSTFFSIFKNRIDMKGF